MHIKIAKTRLLALIEALIVTFLWSTSYILIKIGLEEINPLAFASYRYVIASVVLTATMFYHYRKFLMKLNLRQILLFMVLGFAGYFIAQGLQFFGLYYLQPVTVTFILNLTPLFVMIFSSLVLKETPTYIQFVGIAVTLCGVLVFFCNSILIVEEIIGIVITLVSGIGWAVYMIMVRYYLRDNKENVIILTACSMSLGSLMLFGVTVLTGNVVTVSFEGWIIILWLSVVNTALAFALWNRALKTLRVYEQSILQNSMLIQITVLTFVFLHEALNLQNILGMIMVFIGVLIVQLKSNSKPKKKVRM